MLHKLFYIALGGAAVLVAKAVKGDGGVRPVVKGVYKGIARVNRGFERAAAEIREDLEDARREVEREEAAQQPI
ncbi:MAG: hypothetical protein QOC81_2994 [Thermoanaerobaculia bacterium]|jgi:hypothetical protein|nr:hypothetical protein [Thermoanaerobaculia bacterium]